MSESIDCVVAGHICLDVTPEFKTGAASVGEIFRPGKLIEMGPATVSTGGPVSNTGFPLRRLGNAVQLMGKCGTDMFGRALIDAIRAEAPGAEAGMQAVDGEQTSYTVVVNPPGIDRIFLHCPGANDTFCAADIDLDSVARARLMHFGYPPLMAATYANGGAELVKIFESAKATGVTTSLDMAYPDPAGAAASADWNSILSRTLPHVDVFTPSIEELLLMLDRAEFDRRIATAGQGEMLAVLDADLIASLGQRCIKLGAAVVMIKCGYLGIYVQTASPERLASAGRARPADCAAWAGRKLFQPSYLVESIVSATGAGDCAIAAFLTGLLRGESLDNALRAAVAVGAQNLSAADSVTGVRSWQETLEQIASRPPLRELEIPAGPWKLDPRAQQYVG
ncbi:MAG: carbohydrate kinase family protein [Phycisphaerae bacterium]